jgi:hypothetical protein
MSEVIGKYLAIGKAKFALTTNHPDFPTFASGFLKAIPGKTVGGKRFPASLRSPEVKWFFLREGISRIFDCPSPNDHVVVPQIHFSEEPLVLSLFDALPSRKPAGQLFNKNWKTPIQVLELTVQPHGAKGEILYGLDVNGAAVAIALSPA